MDRDRSSSESSAVNGAIPRQVPRGECHVHTSTLVVMRSVDTGADSVMESFNRGPRLERGDPGLESRLDRLDAAISRRS